MYWSEGGNGVIPHSVASVDIMVVRVDALLSTLRCAVVLLERQWGVERLENDSSLESSCQFHNRPGNAEDSCGLEAVIRATVEYHSVLS